MELRDIEAFVTVAQEHGVRAASVVLNVDPGTVSRAITRLERSVGAQLVTRQSSGVILTHAGHLFLGEARAALVHAGRAALLARHASMPHRVSGAKPIVIGFPPIPAVPEVSQVLAHVRRAAKDHPYTLRRLSWREDFSGDQVRKGSVDIAISVLPGTAKDLTGVALRPVPRVVAFPITHQTSPPRNITPRDLDGLKAVAPQSLAGEALAFWTLDPQSDGKPRRLARRPRSVSELLSQIADGRGFLTLPAFIPLMWQRSDLMFRRLDAPECAIGLTWRPGGIDQQLHDRLVDGRETWTS
ncbi:LysR family transcriptional regulator [Mycobacterium sp. NBC_00419]|uniref:LysR family transcriptional regulator n=1 Tax=Mycobacterium sp. NBC_00419 TaxID=2975989 RepID=UPI002E1F5769